MSAEQAPHAPAAPAGAPDPVLEHALDAPAVVREAPPPVPGRFEEATVVHWEGAQGRLADGRGAVAAASCLLRPAAGDRVVVWAVPGAACRVSVVLEREGEDGVLALPGALTLEARRVGVSAQAVQICAEELLTRTRHRRAVEDTRTEIARVRVAEIGTDIRRATTATDDVSGTFLQRAGTWLSKTAREGRLKARTFLFD